MGTMMKDAKFGRQATEGADSAASTQLATDTAFSRQASPESMNSASVTSTGQQEVSTNVMVEGLVCADTSLDLHLTGDGASVETGTEHESKAFEMYRGLVC